MEKANISTKAKNCKQSVRGGAGPAAHHPRHGRPAQPPCPGGRAGASIPSPSRRRRTRPPRRCRRHPPPEGPARRGGRSEPGPALGEPPDFGACSAEAPSLRPHPASQGGRPTPRGATAPEGRPEPGMGRGWRGSRRDPPPPAPPRAAPPAPALTRRWCVSCWSCNRRPDRGGGAWTWRWPLVWLAGWLGVGRSVRVRRAGALRSLPERRHGKARPTKWRPEGSAGTARGAGARARWPKPPLGASPTAPPRG